MNFYIDFDETLYDTSQLLKDVYIILNNYNITNDVINKYNFDNLLITINTICKNENVDLNIINDINNLLKNGEKYIYKDVYSFLHKLKEKNYNINILTYGNKEYQLSKIKPLSIYNILDKIIVTNKNKCNCNLDYENSIFIDDNTYELDGLYLCNPKDIYRIKRLNSKYYNKETKYNIKTYKSLDSIDIK